MPISVCSKFGVTRGPGQLCDEGPGGTGLSGSWWSGLGNTAALTWSQNVALAPSDPATRPVTWYLPVRKERPAPLSAAGFLLPQREGLLGRHSPTGQVWVPNT